MAIEINGHKVAGLGLPGKSAYKTAQEQGYTGTESELGTALSKVPEHVVDATVHVTEAEKAAWNAKLDNFTEVDPTVPAWAKEPTKPTYTAGEVGALPSNTPIPTKLSDLSEDATHRTVTDAEKTAWSAKADKPKAVPVTLTAAGWDATTLTQTVAVAGVLADGANQVVDISLADRASSKVWADADVWCDSTDADSLTFSCATVPTADINLNIELREVRA